jgi:hypothetical protein
MAAHLFDERLLPVVDDLIAHYPDCNRREARLMVESVAAQFDDAPIQDYVPLLTATICRDRLRRKRAAITR